MLLPRYQFPHLTEALQAKVYFSLGKQKIWLFIELTYHANITRDNWLEI